MCIPHAPINTVGSTGRIKRKKVEKKSIAYNKEERMKADPDFVDTRTNIAQKPVAKKSWLNSLLGT